MAFTAPKWFSYETYMTNKLAQVQNAEPTANWTMTKLVAEFAKAGFIGEEGAYNHFTMHGAAEDVAPNALFNANEYYAAKAAQFYGVEAKAVTELQIANVKALIEKAGYNAWTHYDAFGSDEGVNPSNTFDADAYIAAKAAAMGGDWTKEKVAEAFKANGFTALEHFLTFGGKGEGEISAEQVKAGFEVAADKKVPSSNPGQSYVLTVGSDTVTGTAGDDTINAPLAGAAGTNATLTAGDVIDGGAGTDTLNVYNDAVNFAGVTMKNVEIVKHQMAGNINVSAFADVKEVWQNAAATNDVVTAQLTTKVGFGGTSTGDQKVTFTKADGAADAATVALNGVTMTSVEVTSAVSANEIEAQTLNLTGKNMLSTGFTNAKMTSLSITGDGSLAKDAKGDATAIAGPTATLKSVDASAATGDIALSIANSTLKGDEFSYKGSKGADKLSFSDTLAAHKVAVDLGAGDDTLSVTTAVKAGSTFNGGAGTDTLVFDFAMNADAGKMFTGFENVKLTGTTASYEVGQIAGIIGYEMAATTASTITKLADATTVKVSGNVTTATLTLADNSAATSSVSVAIDNGATTAAAGLTTKIDTNAHVLNLASNGLVTDQNTVTLGDASINYLSGITISGTQAMTLTTGATTALTLVDGAAATGKLEIDAADATKGLTIKGGSADDKITGSAHADVINAGAGDDVITASAGKDTITLGAGADKYVATQAIGAAAANLATITDFMTGIDKIQMAANAATAGTTANVHITTAAVANTEAVLLDALTAALKAGTTNLVADNVYVVELTGTLAGTYMVKEVSTATTVDAADMVVQLAGVHAADLAVGDFLFA